MLAQHFLPEPGAKCERRSHALLQAETAGTEKLGQNSDNMLRHVMEDGEMGEKEQEAVE